MKTALITGVAGQDGSYLAELLLEKGYTVFGLERKEARLDYVPEGIHIIFGDLEDVSSIQNAIRKARPDEIYNFAGISDLKTAYANPQKTINVNGDAVGILLDNATIENPKIRFFQASSSQIFLPSIEPLNENSTRDTATKNPYARAKIIADERIAAAREKGVFASSGILFNHDSPRVGEHFVTKKISQSVAEIKKGRRDVLMVGNLETRRDRSFAGDIVEGAWLMLQAPEPRDYVLASGEAKSLREFISAAFGAVGEQIIWQDSGLEEVGKNKDGKILVRIDPNLYKEEKDVFMGNASKAKNELGWARKTDFGGLAIMMVEDTLKAYSERV